MTDQDQPAIQALGDKDFEVLQSPEDMPYVYIDGAQGFAIANGVARINLYRLVQHFDATGKQSAVKKVISVQLIMPPAVVKNLSVWLTERWKEFEERQKQATAQNAESSDGEQ